MLVSLDDVCARMINHIEERLGRPVRGPVTAASNLVEDLHLDSMESVAMLAELEDHYEVTMPVQMFQRARTLEDVARAVVEVLAQHGRAA